MLRLCLTVAEVYGVVHWRFIDLMNLQFQLLFHPAKKKNHSIWFDNNLVIN